MDLDLLAVNTLRTLAIDTIQKANSGHPGLPLGCAPMAYALWNWHLKHNPKDPSWANRDRFVLSGGHGSSLLYSLLHLTGYDVPMAELQRFRQLNSRTPGHPEAHHTPGVEATTGPLGQGTANAVGLAVAERVLAKLFNRPNHTVVDHYTYALVTDGDLMEGISAEAGALAGHWKLGKLIYLYDANDISLDGPTSITFTEDVAKRYEAYGWQVLHVKDGDHDLQTLDRALHAAKEDTTRPSILIIKTTIGFGSPKKQGTSEAHGSPLGPDEVRATKLALGFDPDQHFHVPEAALQRWRKAVDEGAAAQAAWEQRFAAWKTEYPELAESWRRAHAGELPSGWEKALPTYAVGDDVATRVASGKALNALATKVPWLVGGDADLSCSTNTALKDGGSFDGQSGAGRNFHYGVREHAMASIANGIAYHGGVHSFVATFFVFSDYMRPAVRLACMAGLPVTCVWTHDSIGLGEDGPTHQPVEHLMALRVMPNMTVIRPCDANETVEAWKVALQHTRGPVGLVLSRQKLKTLDRTKVAAAAGLARGAYVLAEAEGGKPDVVLIGTGSEVHLALQARDELQKSGIRARVVSMPSWELFTAQPAAYRDEVLPPAVRARVAVEAGTTLGWERWVGLDGAVVGLDRFGGSAPAEQLYEQFGITAARVVSEARRVMGRCAFRPS